MIFSADKKEKNVSKNEEQIPLHIGSQVFVSKLDLIRIYTPAPDLYTARLADLLFGTEVLQRTTMYSKYQSSLDVLDPVRVASLISTIISTTFFFFGNIKLSLWFFLVHIVQVFQRRGLAISGDMVRRYIKRHINELQKERKN